MKILRSLLRSQWTGTLLALGLASLSVVPAHAIDSGTLPEENSLVYDSTAHMLYGITGGGGLSTPNGTFYQWDTVNNLLTVKHAFATSGEGSVHIGLVRDTYGKFYTCSTAGGANSLGCILKIDPTSSPTPYSVSIVYSITSGDGNEMRGPQSITLGRDGNLYISTLGSTDNSVGADGAIFTITTSGTGKTILKTFSGTHNIQAWGGLVEDATTQGTFYGGTISNTSPRLDSGTLFSITSTGTYATLHTFGGGDGKTPLGAPIVVGSLIYGTTADGGSNSNGTLYKYDLSSSTFTNMYSLLSSTDGSSPKPLVWDSTNSLLYGFCEFGETYNDGSIFKFDPSGLTFTNLTTFTGATGLVHGQQAVSPILVGTTLYGTAFAGGSVNEGDIFKITVPGGGSWADLYDFFTTYTPTGLTATPSAGQIVLNWTDSLATVYDVYRGTTSGGELGTALATDITNTAYTDTNTINGATYYYYIIGRTASSTSTASAEVFATPFPVSPAGPGGLCATSGSSTIAFNWPGTGAKINLYRGSTSGGPYQFVNKQVSLGNGFTDFCTDTPPDNNIYYYVLATSADTYPSTITANSAHSPEVAASAHSAAVPSAPLGLAGTPLNKSVSLTWNAPLSGDTTSYHVKRSTTNGSGYATVNSPSTSCPSSAMSYTDTGLTNNTTYYYVVSAVDGTGEGANSSQITVTPTAPPAPTGLAVATGNAQLSLTWNTATGATSYKIYRGTTSGGESGTVYATSGTNSYTDTSVTNGATYFYQVSGVNSAGTEGDKSVDDATTTTYNTPFSTTTSTAPGITAAAVSMSTTEINITWYTGLGAASINIYRATSSGGPYKYIGPSGGFGQNVTYTDMGLTHLITYYYVAATAASPAPKSNEAHGTQVSATTN